jgi:WD40 repeat protein
VVSGSGDAGLLQVWDPADLGAAPVELGEHHDAVSALAVLPDGRVVSAGGEGRLLVWDPANAGVAPVELGHHGQLQALAVLPDGRVVSGGYDARVLVWDISARAEIARVAGTVVAFATSPHSAARDCRLIVAHRDVGISEFLIHPSPLTQVADQLPPKGPRADSRVRVWARVRARSTSPSGSPSSALLNNVVRRSGRAVRAT